MRATFALIYLQRRPRIARVVKQGPRQWRLMLGEGEPFRYPPGQLLLRWEAEAPEPPAAAADLAAREAAARERAAALDLADLHAGLPPGKSLPLAELAARALPDPADGWARAALYLALLEAPHRFRHRRGAFVARDMAEMERWETREAQARARAAREARLRGWAAALQAGQWPPPGDGESAAFLEQLESLLIEERHSPHWPALARPLGLYPGDMVEARAKVKGWLETARRWRGWPDVWLRRAGVSRDFSREQQRAARALAEAYPHPAGRTDLRGLETLTIDSPGTRDPDDACSVLAADAGGLTVAVHVTELPPALAPGHPLFEEAARRTSSVYTMDGVFPMLPEPLATGRGALLAGKVREAATFTLRLTAAGGELLGLERSLIRIRRNLDYARAEALLDTHPDTWGRLAAFCEELRAVRLAEGAVIGERSGVTIDCRDPGRLRLIRYDRAGPAQRLVEELAILTNREAGCYCRTHRLPAIYRVLTRLRGGPHDPAREEQALPQPHFSIRGGRHAGLAAERYVQVTSPLRRFPDLVMQRQIMEHAATGRVVFADRAQLRAWGEATDARQGRYGDVQRTIAGYWKRRYLGQHLGETLSAVVRRTGAGGRGKAWLEEAELLVDAELPPHAAKGDRLTVRVAAVDDDRQSVCVTAAE